MRNRTLAGWLVLALVALCTMPQAQEGATPSVATASAAQSPLLLRMPNVRDGPLTIRLRDWCHMLLRPSSADPQAHRITYDLMVFSGTVELTVPQVPGAAGGRTMKVDEGFAVSLAFTWQPIERVGGSASYELSLVTVSEPQKHSLPLPEEPRMELPVVPQFTVCGVYKKEEKPIVAGAPEEGVGESSMLRRGSSERTVCKPGTVLLEGDTLLGGLCFETYARFYRQTEGQLALVSVGPASVLAISERSLDRAPRALNLLQGSVRVRLVPLPAGDLLPLASFPATSSLLDVPAVRAQPAGATPPRVLSGPPDAGPPVGPPPITPPPVSAGQ